MSMTVPDPAELSTEEFIALSRTDPETFAAMVLTHGTKTVPPTRPADEPTTKLTAFRLEISKLDALDQLGQRDHLTRTDLLREAVDLVLRKHGWAA
ncbi:hypothetical protein O7627_20060 [Solwaraspora sp. WMMD1047]|uniref:hypothetical protein n=1 Tax=Solwaraspora sp. WMMD1047 TaxID=3016102 RepID=UPI002416591F|nr:hypothetical protein [Solwaraspora sp. WMMD1047]MDG4831578.1 hypothetical protein [Solwaraspora sp. WMMD1047]